MLIKWRKESHIPARAREPLIHNQIVNKSFDSAIGFHHLSYCVSVHKASSFFVIHLIIESEKRLGSVIPREHIHTIEPVVLYP